MQFDPTNEKPIFLQLAEAVENNILTGIYAEETQIPSTTEVALTLKVNPATVNRGVNQLVEEGIIYKKRGVGMFVKQGAREAILQRRRRAFFQDYLLPLLDEARKIGLSREDVRTMLNHSSSELPAERSEYDEQHRD